MLLDKFNKFLPCLLTIISTRWEKRFTGLIICMLCKSQTFWNWEKIVGIWPVILVTRKTQSVIFLVEKYLHCIPIRRSMFLMEFNNFRKGIPSSINKLWANSRKKGVEESDKLYIIALNHYLRKADKSLINHQ